MLGHTDWVWSVTFSPDGQILASSSNDQTIRLWDVQTGQCLKILQGHTNWVRSVLFSPDGQTLISGSEDETTKLWCIRTGKCLKTLISKRPYEGMNITDATGLTLAQKDTLKALGAVEINHDDQSLQVVHPWETTIAVFLQDYDQVTINQVLDYIKPGIHQYSKTDQITISQILRFLGWEKSSKNKRINGIPTPYWFCPVLTPQGVNAGVNTAEDGSSKRQKSEQATLDTVEAKYEADESSQIEHSWTLAISAFVKDYDEVIVNQVLNYIKPGISQHSKADQMVVSKILRSLGWEKSPKNKRINGVPTPYWFRFR